MAGRIRQKTAKYGNMADASTVTAWLRYLYIDGNHKEKLPVLGMRHVVVTCYRGTSVVRNLGFLTLPLSYE